MRLVIISDTHGKHEQLSLPEGDILIHCGDFSAGRGNPLETFDFEEWLRDQDFKYKIYIAGNHDQYAGKHPSDHGGTYYLCDSAVELEGVKFWGMPWTPTFLDWYWMRNRGKGMRKMTDKIPLDTEVLITHGPQAGWLDLTQSGNFVGCEDLGCKIDFLDDLKVHCFGHIHESYGKEEVIGLFDDPQTYMSVNASVLNEKYALVNDPTVVDL